MKNSLNIDRATSLLFKSYFIIVPLLIILHISKFMEKSSIQYCLSDTYLIIDSQLKWIIMPYSLFLIINVLKHEFNSSVILRVRNMRKFWLRISKKILIIAIVETIFIFVITTLAGIGKGPFQCNWSSMSSAAYDALHYQVYTYVNTLVVMIIYMFILFSSIMIFGMITTISWWLLGSPIPGYILMVVDIIVELTISPAPISLYFSKVILNPRSVYAFGIIWSRLLIYPAMLCAVIFLLGLLVFRRKDWLNN